MLRRLGLIVSIPLRGSRLGKIVGGKVDWAAGTRFNPLAGESFGKEFGYKPLPRKRFRRQIDAPFFHFQ